MRLKLLAAPLAPVMAGVVAFAAPSAHAAATSCEALKGMRFGDATVLAAQQVPAGDFTVTNDQQPYTWEKPGESYKPATQTFHQMPTFCRAEGSIRPAPRSDIRFEVWLPVSGWNGRFLAFGNGGAAGFIPYGTANLNPRMAEAVKHGFATVGQNTGHWHSETAALPSEPDKVIDFGYRSMHLATVTAKDVIKAYYGRPQTFSYYAGCSTGGRQGMMEVERFPTDFNGVIAGAGAFNMGGLQVSGAWRASVLSGPGAILPAKVPAIRAAIARQCPMHDGYMDHPEACGFDPGVLLCQNGENDQCLTAPQVLALRTILTGPVNGARVQLYPGIHPSIGVFPVSADTGVKPPVDFEAALRAINSQTVLGEGYFDYMSAANADIRPFVKHGGKLILYHGWMDQLVPPGNTVDLYRRISSYLGPAGDDSVALFLAPGMIHCPGPGPGPNFFGGMGTYVGQSDDPDHSLLAAVIAWVEQGRTPQSVIASKFEDDKTGGRTVITGLLCRYPNVAWYRGSGSREDAANYDCGPQRLANEVQGPPGS